MSKCVSWLFCTKLPCVYSKWPPNHPIIVCWLLLYWSKVTQWDGNNFPIDLHIMDWLEVTKHLLNKYESSSKGFRKITQQLQESMFFCFLFAPGNIGSVCHLQPSFRNARYKESQGIKLKFPSFPSKHLCLHQCLQ